MKVNKINFYIQEFKKEIAKDRFYPYSYKWEALHNYQNNWNEERKDLKETYNLSFQSNESGRLWGGEHNSSKSAMLQMIDWSPDFMRTAFRDLFRTDHDVMQRCRRFFSHCEEAMSHVDKGKTKKQHHHHDGFSILTVYLCFQFPTQYAIFDFDIFETTMKKLEINNLPKDFEVERFFKLSKALSNFLFKDQELIASVNTRLEHDHYAKAPTMLLVHDFYEFVASANV